MKHHHTSRRWHGIATVGILAITTAVAPAIGGAAYASAPAPSTRPTNAHAGQSLPPDLAKLYGSRPAYQDEFNGTSVNQADWYYRITEPSYTGGYGTADAVTESAGSLHLNYSKRDVSGDGVADFVGGGIISRQLFGYGFYQVRARLYDGTAPLHTSFWSMGLRKDISGAGAASDPRINQDIADSVFPENNQLFEIDGFEHDSPDSLGQGNIPQSQGTDWARSPYKSGAELGVNFTDWNVYGYEYTPQSIKFYINGILRFTVDNAATKYQYNPMNLWLTALPYFPEAGQSVTPGSSDFDYFRYYNRPLQGANLLGNPSFDALPNTNPGTWIIPGWIESGDNPASQIATDDVVDGGRSLLQTGTTPYGVTT